jgi:hypothetical protein
MAKKSSAVERNGLFLQVKVLKLGHSVVANPTPKCKEICLRDRLLAREPSYLTVIPEPNQTHIQINIS